MQFLVTIQDGSSLFPKDLPAEIRIALEIDGFSVVSVTPYPPSEDTQ